MVEYLSRKQNQRNYTQNVPTGAGFNPSGTAVAGGWKELGRFNLESNDIRWI